MPGPHIITKLRKKHEGLFVELTDKMVVHVLKSIKSEVIKNKVKGRELSHFLETFKKKINEIDVEFVEKPKDSHDLLIYTAILYVNDKITETIDEATENIRSDRHFHFISFLDDSIDEYTNYQPPTKRSRKDKVEEEEEEEEEIDDEDADDEEEELSQPNIQSIFFGSHPLFSAIGKENSFRSKWEEEFDRIRRLSTRKMAWEECFNYLKSLKQGDRDKMLKKAESVESHKTSDKPVYFQIMDMDIPLDQKNHILRVFHAVNSDSNNKSKAWLERALRIPFGKSIGTNLNEVKDIPAFINDLKSKMDEAVWGHDDAKRLIIQVMCQQIRNNKANGTVLGIAGPPGNGKSSLVKEGIAKAMGRPFIFISLGGATDASFLEGHSFTYEGSIPGRIAEALIECQCMNPIIYFDELDKISKTHKGHEIHNLLVHLTDPVQNNQFRDKYFHGVSLDLSKATFIFSYNDVSNVNPILLDRITQVKTNPLTRPQKLKIAASYLLPGILKDVGLATTDIVFEDKVLENLIDKHTREGGVRRLKEIMYHIVREVNIMHMSNQPFSEEIQTINFPFTVSWSKDLKKLLTRYHKIKDRLINKDAKVGVINGLYASSNGVGGILPIEMQFFPSRNPLTIKKTGSLEKVISESAEVALSVAWNLLSDEVKQTWKDTWKSQPEGIHLHCPEGAVSKDGPSAGGALTIAYYSLFTNKPIQNDFAMTGEINLQGQIMAIGGLQEKLTGAKLAGVTKALVPKENEEDFNKVLKDNPNLIDDTFKVYIVDNIYQVMDYVWPKVNEPINITV